MNGYTPRPPTGSRKKKLTLSAKEYTKIAGTIASVRKNRHLDEDVIERTRSSHGEPSFIAETSFVKAPLNSRISSIGVAASTKAKGKGKVEEGLDRIPLEVQEALVLEDLLYVLMGIEGTYVTYHPDYSPEDDDPLQGIRFTVSASLDSSLRDLVERILPLGTYYTGISSFIELRSHLDYGLVNHALCAAIREMLKDYQTLLSQLEHAYNSSSQFSLQKLWFYVHPTVHTLSLIYQLILELGYADEPTNSLSSESEDDDDDDADEALGLGGAKLKAVLSSINKNGGDSSDIAVKGGEVLTIIYERMQSLSGDPTASTIYGTLLKKAGKPYVEMLRAWISAGKLVDRYEELLVRESKFINRGMLDVDYTDEYWEKRYTLRDGGSSRGQGNQAGVPPARSNGRLPGGACVPPLLEAWKHKILLAGKYLNVIRECGIAIGGDASEEEFGMDDEKFYVFLESAYTNANQTLLRLLLKDQQLLPRLRSLKRYFFLSSSFFLTHLLDQAHSELRKSAKSASIVKLQSLMDLALREDNVSGDDAIYREDVKVVLATSGLYDWLQEIINLSGGIPGNAPEDERDKEKIKEDQKSMLAIDALSLDYNVKFPLSLVISRKTILRYQLLFRFLLHLKHVEQALSAMWIEQKTIVWRKSVVTRAPPVATPTSRPPSSASHRPPSSAARAPPTPVSPPTQTSPIPTVQQKEFDQWRLRVFLLRARMLSFVQHILAFATFEVLEPNWQRLLEDKIGKGKVNTVDELLRDHVDFLDTCLKECMLTSSKLLKAHQKLMRTCSTFAMYAGPFTKSATSANENESDKDRAKRWDVFTKFEKNFNHWFDVYLDCVQFYASSENVSLLPLVVRLNSVKGG